MDEEMKENRFEGMSAEQIWSELYGKELNSKKTILEYIEMIGVLKKQDASENQLEETYNFIYGKIEEMKEVIKPNTSMYLKNRLKAQLGKYVAEKDPVPRDEFIEFLKQAYPENERRKDFTWVSHGRKQHFRRTGLEHADIYKQTMHKQWSQAQQPPEEGDHQGRRKYCKEKQHKVYKQSKKPQAFDRYIEHKHSESGQHLQGYGQQA